MAKAEAQAASGNTKRSKAAASGKAPNKGKDQASGDKGAPRPRKHDYGIVPEHKVQLAEREGDEPKLKAQEAEGYEIVKKGKGKLTVAKFMEQSSRAILRRLSRKGLVNVIGADGTVYPKAYEAPPPKAKKSKAEDKEAA